MRWPLSVQILVRLLLLLMVTVSAITYANIRNSITATRDSEKRQLRQIVELMNSTKFPLTDVVLDNMKSLSGAEFILTDSHRKTVSSTDRAPLEVVAAPIKPEASVLYSNMDSFYHASLQHSYERSGTPSLGTLHVLVNRQSDRSVFWQASQTPLTIALIVLPIAILVGIALAGQVTRPLARLKQQVSQIADGHLEPVPVNRVNDEIRDLAISTNELADKLKDQEVQLRKNERLNTLVQVGSGMAHQLRNSSTGCRMAVELLASEREEISQSENYQVAIRQLELMDNYIKKFTLLAKSSEMPDDAPTPIDLKETIDNVLFLVRPAANHLNVDLKVSTTFDGSQVSISSDDAEQLMINLLTNGITAASHTQNLAAAVSAQLCVCNGQFKFEVCDNGPGPPESIAPSMFQPFVTESTEGTGLGLSLVQQIAERCSGTIDWRREDNQTVFVFHSIRHFDSWT